MLKLYENIKNRRKEMKMTQEELAQRTGYTDRSSIAKIEKGEVDLPQSKIKQFAEALGTTPGQLMGWESNPTEAGAVAANVLRDPDVFKFVKKFLELDEVDRYALGLVMESMELKKAQKKTDAEAPAVKESVVETE